MHNLDQYYHFQRRGAYCTHELINTSIFLLVKWGHSSPWSTVAVSIVP